MEYHLLVTAAMTLLGPFLTKAGEKAAEKIGEKFGEKATEADVWKKVKEFFVQYEPVEVIDQIEQKTVASPGDVTQIEEMLKKELKNNPQSAQELQNALNLSSTNLFIAEHLLRSIEKDRDELSSLFEERRLASVDAVGGYENMIARTCRRLEKDEAEFIKLVTGK